MRRLSWFVALAAVVLAASFHPLGGAALGIPVQQAVATLHDSLFHQLSTVPNGAPRTADVTNFTIRRDVAAFILESGQLYFLDPVDGRTVAAVFVGAGRFAFAPPTRVEREQLVRAWRTPALERPFTELFLFFADSTVEELAPAVTWNSPARSLPESVRAVARRGLQYLSHGGRRYFDPHLMTALLNGERNESFFAMVDGASGGRLLFQIDPYAVEEVTLAVPKPGPALAADRAEVVNQFHWARDYAPEAEAPDERKERFGVRRYTIDARIAGNLAFRASATLSVDWWGAPQEWFSLFLFPELTLDSARWEGGARATVVRGRDNPVLWVQRPEPAGAMPPLTVHYHGDLLERIGPWFNLKTSNGWYPSPAMGYGSPVAGTFDLTFHTPRIYKFASIGDLVEKTVTGDVLTTHWVTTQPSFHASFNIGRFEEYEFKDPRNLPVTVLINQEAHNQVPSAIQRRGQIRVIPRQANMKETVGEDVALSMNYFRDAFGEPPVRHFYATEILGGHGQAFPGLIHLSWATYQGFMLEKGQDEAFRSHEVAHQWWGLGVGVKSYRDAWLSEGFATFASWRYTEAVLGDTTLSLILRRSRDALLARRKDAGPIWLGTRLAAGEMPQDYGLIVYHKGAWVLRMLRHVMLDPGSGGEESFRELLHNFYEKNRGSVASTEEFQAAVERYVTPIDWFFNSWVYGTGIPTYEWSHAIVQGAGDTLTLKLRVEQREVPDDFAMVVPVRVEFAGGQFAAVRLMVKGPTNEFAFQVPSRPSGVVFNPSNAVLAEVKETRWK
ncbi:MAG TPA: M1 family aminopeptidase [Gemmatimonadales bacterium]